MAWEPPNTDEVVEPKSGWTPPEGDEVLTPETPAQGPDTVGGSLKPFTVGDTTVGYGDQKQPPAKVENTGYAIDDQPITHDQLKDLLFNNDFIERMQNGQVNITLPDDPEMEALVKRQANAGTRFGDKWDWLVSGGYDLATGLIGLPDYLGNVAKETANLFGAGIEGDISAGPSMGASFMTAPLSKAEADAAKAMAKKQIEKTRQYEEGFVGSIANGDFVAAADQAFNSVAQSIPLAVSTIATGGGAGALASMGTVMASSEYADADQYKGLSNAENVLRSGLYGGFEAFGELVTGGILTKNLGLVKMGLKSMVKKAAQQGGEQAAQTVAMELGKKMPLEIFKEYGVDLLKEGGSELVTEMGQMGTDDIMGVHDYSVKDYINNGLEALSLGVASAGIMGGPTASKGVKRYVDERLKKTNGQELNRRVDAKVKENKITPEEGEVAKQNIEKRVEAVNAVPDEVIANTKVVDLIEKKQELEKQKEELDPMFAPLQQEKISEIDDLIKAEISPLLESVKKEKEKKNASKKQSATAVGELTGGKESSGSLRGEGVEPINQGKEIAGTGQKKVEPAVKPETVKEGTTTKTQTNEQNENAKGQEAQGQENVLTAQEAATIPQEGATVTIKREGGSERKMVYSGGVWKQQVGGQARLVDKSVRDQAQGEWKKAQTPKESTSTINVAPFYDTKAETAEQAASIEKSPAYQQHLQTINQVADGIGVKIKNITTTVGGYTHSKTGKRVNEVSTVVELETDNLDKASEFAALMGTLSPEVQESTIASQHIKDNERGGEKHTANQIVFKVDNFDNALKAVQESGLDYTANPATKEISMLDFQADWFDRIDFDKKIDTFVSKLNERGVKYEEPKYFPIESRLIEAEGEYGRETIYQKIRDEARHKPGGTMLRDALQKAQERNTEFIRQQKLEPQRIEYEALRTKQIELNEQGKELSTPELKKLAELYDQLLPHTETTFKNAEQAYIESKLEIESVAEKIAGDKGFVSAFNLKNPSRAAVKTLRWYKGKAHWLGDGARTNIIVENPAEVKLMLDKIRQEYGGGIVRDIAETTDLGYPKGLIEVRTKNGRIAEIQVMTPEGYLAKDGVRDFPKDKQEYAQQKLDAVRERVGFDIPDGSGHYLYELNRDPHVPKEIRDEAKRLSNQYYDAFLNGTKIDGEAFKNDFAKLVEKVDAADKSKWDKGNKAVAPESVKEFIAADTLSKKEAAKKKVDEFTESTISVLKDLHIISDDPNIKKSGFVDIEKAVRFIGEAIKKGIDLHGDLKKAVNEAIEKFKASDIYKSLSPDESKEIEGKIREKSGIKEEAAEPSKEPGEKKKKVLTERAYEGAIRDEVKKHIEAKGLFRESFSPEQRSQQATDFINEFGEEAAFEAAKNLDIRGALATSVLSQLAGKIENKMAALSALDVAELDALGKKQADVFELMEREGYFGGEFSGQLAYEYENSNIAYNYERKIAEYKAKSKDGTIPEDVEKRFKEYDAKIKELNKKLAEAEKMAADKKEVEEKKDAPQREKRIKEAGKKLADAIRKGKLHRPGAFASATPGSIVWDGAIEAVAKTVEAGSSVAQAVADGINFIKNSDWYKSLSSEKQKEAEGAFNDFFSRDRIKEETRIKSAKTRLQNEINKLEEDLASRTFEKKPKLKPIDDSEVIQLRAEKLRLKELWDKEFYKLEVFNRTAAQKRWDRFWEMWGLTRLLRATGEYSFVLVQGLTQTIKYALTNPKVLGDAFRKSGEFFASESKTKKWLSEIKSQDWYQELKGSKLSLTEPDGRLSVREELMVSHYANILWNMLGNIVKPLGDKVYEKWKTASPFSAFERASIGYLDTIRVTRWLEGRDALRKQGIFFKDNPQAYKEMADVVNTLTGRASIGALEKNSEVLSRVLFSPRNWSSAIKTATPYAFYHFGKMRAGAKGWKPTVAQKMAIVDLTTQVATTIGVLVLYSAWAASDDDPETGVETDPRSSDFGKMRLSGGVRVDPWGGKIQQVVLTMRILAEAAHDALDLTEGGMKTSKGEIVPLGTPMKSKSMETTMLQMAINKLSPSLSIAERYASSTEVSPGKVVDSYGEPYSLKSDLIQSTYPIYAQTLADLSKDGFNSIDAILAFYSFFGGGVQQYKKKPPVQQSSSTTESISR